MSLSFPRLSLSTLLLPVAAGLLLSLGACGHMNTRQQNTAVGAGVGAAAGAILTGGSVVGAGVGAAVGGVIGHEVGKR